VDRLRCFDIQTEQSERRMGGEPLLFPSSMAPLG
jgi:hypothetical protein